MKKSILIDAQLDEPPGAATAKGEQAERKARPLIDQENFVSRFLLSAIAYHEALVVFHTGLPDTCWTVTG